MVRESEGGGKEHGEDRPLFGKLVPLIETKFHNILPIFASLLASFYSARLFAARPVRGIQRRREQQKLDSGRIGLLAKMDQARLSHHFSVTASHCIQRWVAGVALSLFLSLAPSTLSISS